MNLNTCEAHKNEYNPLYYSTDTKKAACGRRCSRVQNGTNPCTGVVLEDAFDDLYEDEYQNWNLIASTAH